MITAQKQIQTAKPNCHILDIENLAGTGKLTPNIVSQVRENYFAKVHPNPKDVFFIAAGTQNKWAVMGGWPNSLYQFKPGKDGADILIAQFCSQLEHTSRFGRGYLASGDGALSPYAQILADRGLDLRVVARSSSCSWKLKKFELIDLETELQIEGETNE